MQRVDISKAIEALSDGEVIVYPTDTLYGLGANIYNTEAVNKVFEIKKRSKGQSKFFLLDVSLPQR